VVYDRTGAQWLMSCVGLDATGQARVAAKDAQTAVTTGKQSLAVSCLENDARVMTQPVEK
jgi:hypothetical protein